MRRIEDPNTQRDWDWEREREIPKMATRFKEEGEKPITPLSQNQNPKLRWERSKRSEVPFLCNLRFSHTMATDSSDQLNFNPTTTTEENPKQTLDDDTTLTSLSSLQLHVNTGQNNGFNSPLLDSLCSVSYCLHISFKPTNEGKKKIQKEAQKKIVKT